MKDYSDVFDLLENTKVFTKSLKRSENFEFNPLKKGYFDVGEKLSLGFSTYGMKLYYMLGMWDDLQRKQQETWIKYINSFQVSNSSHGNNFFIDSALVDWYSKTNINETARNIIKFILNKFAKTSYDLKSTKLDKAINADTKQAISTLYEVGAKNLLVIPDKFNGEKNLLNYLDNLDWSKPWSSGAQYSSFCVYSISQGYQNQEALIKFADNLVDKKTGSYFKVTPKEPREIINGAMKVITGLDWLKEKIHYPEQLIDFCLNNVPVNEGCDIVDYIYVLYKCSEETDHRKNEIQLTMIKAIEQIKLLYVPEDKGFSYFENKSQTHYYGVPFSKGLPTADLHGTILCVWGLLMALKTLNCDIKPYRIIKP